jgi:hypothetical protein
MVIAEEGNADCGRGLTEEAETGLGVGAAVDGIDLPGGVGFEFGPGEGSGHGESYSLWSGLVVG